MSYFTFVVLSHGKLDRRFFFMAGPKSANLQQTTGPKSLRKIIVRVLEKYVRLVAPTYASPKVPRKERLGPRGFEIISKTSYHA